jgi:type I site-specific restriction endonuclease
LTIIVVYCKIKSRYDISKKEEKSMNEIEACRKEIDTYIENCGYDMTSKSAVAKALETEEKMYQIFNGNYADGE